MAIKDSYLGLSPYSYLSINYDPIIARGQWFTASSSYTVTSVDIFIRRPGGTGSSGTVTVNLCVVDDNNLPSTILATNTFNTTLYSSAIWVQIDLSVALTSGTIYCITVIPDGVTLEWAHDTYPTYNTGSKQWHNGENWITEDGTGSDHRFRVNGVSLPSKPINPTPKHEGSGVSLSATTVTWEDGGGADTYNIYYGTLSGFLSLVAEGVSDLEIALVEGNFDHYGEIYYWRVDAVNDAGVTQGDEWAFTALIYDPVLPHGVTLVNGEPTGTPDGENNMITVKRLVAAAENAIWFEDI